MKTFAIITLISLSFISCGKAELYSEDKLNNAIEIVEAAEPIEYFTGTIETLDISVNTGGPTSKALNEVETTINGVDYVTELVEDFYYDDEKDNLIHLSQFYSLEVIVDTFTEYHTDENNVVTETQHNVINTIFFVYDILINNESNTLANAANINVVVLNNFGAETSNETYFLDAASTTIDYPNVSYSNADQGLTFNVSL